MKIIVCLKQVPDTETKIKIAANQTTIDSSGIKWIVNPYDELAIEEAVKLKEKNPGSTVFALTVGPKQRVSEALRTALAMGCDEGIVVNSSFEMDSLSVASALAAAIKGEGGADLILFGKLAIDDNGSAVGPMLAEMLELAHVSVVSKLEINGADVIAERDIEGGAKEVFSLKLPCIITANKGLNTPRYASLPGIMKAKKKVLKEIEIETLGVTAASVLAKTTQVLMPDEKSTVKLLTGDVPTQVTDLVKLLRDEAKAL